MAPWWQRSTDFVSRPGLPHGRASSAERRPRQFDKITSIQYLNRRIGNLSPLSPAFCAAQVSSPPPVQSAGQGLQWSGISDGDRRSMDDSDEALMARVARGDERAFRELARRHVPAMLGLARRILGNAADAEDVAQEAMLRVWTQAPRWQPLAALRTWLSRVVVNLCLDRKRRAAWVELEAAGEIADPAPLAGEQRGSGRTRAASCRRHRRTAGAPARRHRAQLHRGHEQCPGGRHSRHHRLGGGDFAGARQAEPAPRAGANDRRGTSKMTDNRVRRVSRHGAQAPRQCAARTTRPRSRAC